MIVCLTIGWFELTGPFSQVNQIASVQSITLSEDSCESSFHMALYELHFLAFIPFWSSLPYWTEPTCITSRTSRKWYCMISKSRSIKTLWLSPCYPGVTILEEVSHHILRIYKQEARVGKNWSLLPTSSTMWVSLLGSRSSRPSQVLRWCSPCKCLVCNLIRGPEPETSS